MMGGAGWVACALWPRTLCTACAQAGAQTVGDIEQLPKEMGTMYKEVLNRVTSRGQNELANRLLLLLTETKASLATEVVAEFLEVSPLAANAAIDDCMELLFEDPITPDVLDYQLFHESLREYIRATQSTSCRKMAEQVTERCYGWGTLEGLSLDYDLEFAAIHLKERADGERLWLGSGKP